MDKGHRLPTRLARDMDIRRCVDENATTVGPVNPAQNLDQRGFSGAVFAQQRYDLAPPDLERRTAQSLGAAKAFGDAVKEQAVRGGWHSGSSPIRPRAFWQVYR